MLIISIVWFFLGIVFSYIFTGILYNIVPGGNSDVKIVIGITFFIAGEIAFCTSMIMKKLNGIIGEKVTEENEFNKLNKLSEEEENRRNE